MVQVFDDCSNGKYQKQVVASVKGVKDSEFFLEIVNGSPVPKGIVTESSDGTIILENVSNENESKIRNPKHGRKCC